MQETEIQSLKICVGASAGGHMNQLLKLLEFAHLWPSTPALYVTTMPELAKKLETKGKTYVVGECNRQHPIEAVKVFFRGLLFCVKGRMSLLPPGRCRLR